MFLNNISWNKIHRVLPCLAERSCASVVGGCIIIQALAGASHAAYRSIMSQATKFPRLSRKMRNLQHKNWRYVKLLDKKFAPYHASV